MKVKHRMSGVISILLTAVLVFTFVPFSAAAKADEPQLKIAVISDPHHMPAEYISDENGFNFRQKNDNDCKMLVYSDEILDAALDNIIEQSPDVLLIAGDLAHFSEQLAHEQLSAKLKKVENAGVDCFVVPGNHDVSPTREVAAYELTEPKTTFTAFGNEYVEDTTVSVEGTSVADFKSLYSDFGYGDDGRIVARLDGTLSYVADLGEYRIIAIDPNIYNDDGTFTKTRDLSGERLKWVIEQIEACCAAGDVPIAFMHYNLIEKYPGQSVVMGNNYMKNHSEITKAFANAGLQYVFTGHSHATELVGETTSKDNTLYEICTGSLVLYGSPYRFVSLNGADAEITTEFLPATPQHPDFQAFAKEYYKGSARTIMRNRAIVAATPAIAEVLSEKLPLKISHDRAYQFATELMDPLITELLETPLTDEMTVSELLEAAYAEHYAGDEKYSEAVRASVAAMKKGDVFEHALNLAFRSIGGAMGISAKLAEFAPNYRKYLDNFAAGLLRERVARLLGGLGGVFIEGIFIDPSPMDLNVKIVGGTAYQNGEAQQKRTPAYRSREAVNKLSEIFRCAVSL